MAVGERGRDDGGCTRHWCAVRFFMASSLTGFTINTCHVLTSVKVSSERWKISYVLPSIQLESGNWQAVSGWGGQVPRAEFRISDGRRVWADPKERSCFHVNRAFVTLMSSNAWTVMPTLTRPFSSRMWCGRHSFPSGTPNFRHASKKFSTFLLHLAMLSLGRDGSRFSGRSVAGPGHWGLRDARWRISEKRTSKNSLHL